MENACYSMGRMGNPGIPLVWLGIVEAGSVDMRPWLGLLLLVGGWLEKVGDGGLRLK